MNKCKQLTRVAMGMAILSLSFSLRSQTYIAIDVPAGTPGNHAALNWGIGSDFSVVRPITVSQLGVFDDQTNGFNGSGTLTVQLYQHHGEVSSLLETLTFDAANPGGLVNGNRFKPLGIPVTLLPGEYSVIAYGFDQTNRNGRAVYYTNSPVPWVLNDGGGLIQFHDGRHGRGAPGHFPHVVNTNQPDAFCGATFIYSPAALPTPAYASDYAQLTAGITQVPFTGQRRSGGVAVFNYNSFPVLVEPSGSRLVLEAAGKYNDDANGGRGVVFAQSEWGRYGDVRGSLFENAVVWASRKINPADIVVGMGPLLNTNYFIKRGYQVVMLPTNAAGIVPPCDVIAVNWNASFDDAIVAQIAQLNAQGTGLVMTSEPWLLAHEGIKPAFYQANSLLQPYGLGYRPSTAIPRDLSFTNVMAFPYPVYFSAFPAAELLGQDHLGSIHLDSLEKEIALNTINTAINVRPDLMETLTALSTGSTNSLSGPSSGVSSFVDNVVMSGSQASTNQLGQWTVVGNDIVAGNRRGVVEYDFNLASADMDQLQIVGTQDQPNSTDNDFDLKLTVDGVNLGHHHLVAGYGTNGAVTCMLPYLPAGAHTLRILWDNVDARTSLRLKAIHFLTGLGPDNNGNGIKDWVEQYAQSQSGMDLTNPTLTSIVSPICLEGRDPYPALMQMSVQGSQNTVPTVNPAPNNRWYANVALPRDQNTPLVLNVTYQNGAVSEWRTIQWQPVNVFAGGSYTIRQGDSLLFLAQPANLPVANMSIVVGTNQLPTQANAVPFKFTQPGTYTVTGTYKPNSANPQSGSLTVNVIGYQFPTGPDVWALNAREWDLTNIPSQAVFQADNRVIFEPVATLANNGQSMELISDQNDPRYILARLGNGGPILDSVKMKDFQFWSSEATYTQVMTNYPDGSQLVETMLVSSPVPADLSVKMDVSVGGVIFTDGTTSKTFVNTDFDALGRCKVQFIRPASARTSVCHHITLLQGSDVVGTVQ